MSAECWPLLALLALLGSGCVPEDRGLLVRDGQTLHADELPVCVSCELPDCSIIDDAASWWAAQLGAEVFWWDDGCPIVVRETDIPPDALGQTIINYSADGTIRACEIELQRGEWEWLHLLHELGHCPLGLDDDPPSIDLESVMESPVYDEAVTDHDRELLREYYGL